MARSRPGFPMLLPPFEPFHRLGGAEHAILPVANESPTDQDQMREVGALEERVQNFGIARPRSRLPQTILLRWGLRRSVLQRSAVQGPGGRRKHEGMNAIALLETVGLNVSLRGCGQAARQATVSGSGRKLQNRSSLGRQLSPSPAAQDRRRLHTAVGRRMLTLNNLMPPA